MKKFLALALAATTAFSMFGSSLSASALSYQNDEGFANSYYANKMVVTATGVTITPVDADKDGNPVVGTPIVLASNKDLTNLTEHLVFGSPADSDTASKQDLIDNNPGLRDQRYGAIYMYDYAWDDNSKDAKEQEKDVERLRDLISTMQRDDKNNPVDAAKFYSAFKDAYNGTGLESGWSSAVTLDRWSALNALRLAKRDAQKYMYKEDNGTWKPDMNLFDAVEAKDYNLYNLIMAVHTMNGENEATSRVNYITTEFNRIIEEVSMADTTNQMDEYYEKLAKVEGYESSDYTASNWRQVQNLLEDAADAAEKAKTVADWKDVIDILDDAISVPCKTADYSELETALLGLYSDAQGKTKPSYIQQTYKGVNATSGDHYLYLAADYRVRNGYSDAWNDFAVDTYKYNSNSLKVIDEYSAYTYAEETYRGAKKLINGARIKQSEINKALEELNTAVDALSATTSTPEWKIIKLQASVDTAKAYKESDFNTTSRKWKTFTGALDTAEKTLAKTNPGASELDRVTTTLDNAITDIKSSAKAIPSATKTELKDLIKEADRMVANVTTQTGAQVAALREASDIAADIYANISVTGKDKAVISDVETAIADLKTAIANFNNPQGWHQVDGKWYFGAGAELYKGEWKQIGNAWYMFNEDGSMKSSEWFQKGSTWYYSNANGTLATGWNKIGGQWYYFNSSNAMKTGWAKIGNNWFYLATSGKMVTGWNWINGKCYFFNASGVMASNTTVGGYKLDATGAWVK